MRGDPTQVFEAVLNLCTNAMQAMPQGGRLCVTIRREHLPAPRVLSHGRIPAGEYVRVSVEDDGAGMSSEVLEHLFEPFYTTRAAESGTGLGLAVVHGVVAECGGAVDVRSAPGHGATFTLYFPEALDAAPTLTPQRVAPAPGRGEALLVVDDDPAIVSMAVETLADLGYQASGTVDPAAALRALGSSGGGFAAVITDEVMPGMSGTELTRRIRAQLPSLPVLLVSGYGGASLAARATEAGVTRLLGKPLQRAELASALDEVLH
jgi:CheY-like chemotaxis protein